MCGIYCIENLVNNKKYIGQSVNIKRRFSQHKSLLNSGKHENEYLQRSWNKYGVPRSNIDKCIKGKRKSAGKHPITSEKLTWVDMKK